MNQRQYVPCEKRGRLLPTRPIAISFLSFAFDLPTPAITLWETFREPLSADFALNNNEDEANRLTLQTISRHLQSQGASLVQFGLAEQARVDCEVNLE